MFLTVLDGARGTGKTTLAAALRRRTLLPIIEVGVLFRVLALYTLLYRNNGADRLLRQLRCAELLPRGDISSPMAGMSVYLHGRAIDRDLWSPLTECLLPVVAESSRGRSVVAEVLRIIMRRDATGYIVTGREAGSLFLSQASLRIHLVGSSQICLARKRAASLMVSRRGFGAWAPPATDVRVFAPNSDVSIDTTDTASCDVIAIGAQVVRDAFL